MDPKEMHAAMTDEEIATLRALLREMTPGPWHRRHGWIMWREGRIAPMGVMETTDIEGIVALVNAAPRLLDTVEAYRTLRERIEALHFQSELNQRCAHCGGHWPCLTVALLVAGGRESRAGLTENERTFIFMVHEVNRQLGAVDDAIVRGNLAAAQSITRHLISRTGGVLDNLKTMDLAEALKDVH